MCVAFAVGFLATACTTEEPTAIDFTANNDATTVPLHDTDDGSAGGLTDAPADGSADPNSAQRSMVFGLAEQQCLDDPELAQGVVQIAMPDTGEVVNEVSVECDEVRARADAGEPAGVELIPEELRPDGS